MRTATPRLRGIIGLSFCTVILAACGGDDDSPTGPSLIDITGTWRISYTNLNGDGGSCFTSPIDFQIIQIGTTFSGSSNSTWSTTCTVGGDTSVSTVTGAQINNGQISSSTITFDFGLSTFENEGTVSGNSMSGTSMWVVETPVKTFHLTGQFSGVKL